MTCLEVQCIERTAHHALGAGGDAGEWGSGLFLCECMGGVCSKASQEKESDLQGFYTS